jgi:L-amino acid N-acyltransferase
MQFVNCSFELHATAILEMLNEAIANSTALYEYEPRSMASMRQWFNEKSAFSYPIIGAEDEQGTLLGFATYGVFRAKPAYKYSVEHSLYVHDSHRGQGVGRALLQRIIFAAIEQNYHVMIGGIDADNHVSIALHQRLGFENAGTIRQAGFKFGRWLDLAFYQLTLPTPAQPNDAN